MLESCNSLLFIVCDGDWGLYATRFTVLTPIATYNGVRFSVSYDISTLTLTDEVQENSTEFVIYELK